MQGAIASALEGSVYGPELTRIGAGRSPEYIRESMVNPSADIPEEYHRRNGRCCATANASQGVRINEDTFTVQLRDPSQNFRMFQKDDIAAGDPRDEISDAGLSSARPG